MPERDVMDRLKISYDALEYEAKEIFLDIACLYIGKTKERPFYMWSDCHFFPTNNINLLIQRSMIRIGDDGTFQMHDQLRDMGREIVRRENIEHPWMRSRIWSYKTARELLREKKGTNQVKAIKLGKSSSENEDVDQLEGGCFVNLSELRYFEASSAKLVGDFDNLLPNLRWLRLSCQEIVANDLSNFHMKNLVILDLRGNQVGDDWGGWTQLKMANKLKVLDLYECINLTKLPKLPESGSLEVLDLGRFRGRTDEEELDIGKLRNLMVLNLRDSSMKKIVGGTIGIIGELRELDVSDCRCKNLGQVFVDVDRLQSLQILRTASSSTYHLQQVVTAKLPTSLKELSTSSPIKNLAELIELEMLKVHHCEYGLEIPPADQGDDHTWWKRSKLKVLELKKVSKMWCTNSNNNNAALLPSSLTSLEVLKCKELEWLPSLENLENLTKFVVEDCPMPREIRGLGGLKALKTLRISNASNLRRLDKGLDNLWCLSSLELQECGALERLSGIESLTHLELLLIEECPLLKEIEGIGGMTSLQELEIHGAQSLIGIDGRIGNKLKSLIVWGCPRLTSLSLFQDQLYDDHDDHGGGPRGGVVKSLETLAILGCTSLLLQDGLQLPHLSKFPMLKYLTLQDVKVKVKKMLTVKHEDEEEEELSAALEGLDCLKELVEMELGNLPLIERVPSLSKLANLEKLSITDMPSLREIEGLARLKSLQFLQLSECTSLKRVDYLSDLEALEMIVIQGCTKLERLPSLSNQGKLRVLEVKDMPSLREIEGLAGLRSLHLLKLIGCTSLERVDSLSVLEKLKTIQIQGCTKLERLPSLSNLGKLRILWIKDMPNLREIDNAYGLACLTSLEWLNLTGCSSLETLTVNLPRGLKMLNVGGCTSLTNLSQLENCLPRTIIVEDEAGGDDLYASVSSDSEYSNSDFEHSD